MTVCICLSIQWGEWVYIHVRMLCLFILLWVYLCEFVYMLICVSVCIHVCVYVSVSTCMCDIWNMYVYSLSLYNKFTGFSLRNSSLVRIRTVFSYCFVYILSHYLTLLYVEMHRRPILHNNTMYLRMNLCKKTWLRKINAGEWVI